MLYLFAVVRWNSGALIVIGPFQPPPILHGYGDGVRGTAKVQADVDSEPEPEPEPVC
jgi:hypothetical protein